MSPPSHGWLVVVLAAVVLVHVTCLDSMYEGCEPRQCGRLNISYPFWIVNDDQGKNNSVCGYRGFDMRCINDRPVYRTSGAQYTIKNIAYDNNSFQVVDLQVINSSCPTPTQNFSFDRSAVDFGPRHVNLNFFYGCNKFSPLVDIATLIKVPCDRNKSYVSFVGLLNGSTPDWPNKTQCETFVSTPVELEESRMNSTIKDLDYAELLKEGFTLKWTGLYDCGRCRRSGGRCGYSHENETSVCFCPDQPHALDCNDGRRHEWQRIGLGIGIGGLAVVLGLLSLCTCFRKQFPMKRASSVRRSGVKDQCVYFEVPIFTSRELEEATDRFSTSNELGDGGFGTVYYGKLRDGREVAVKRLFEHNSHRVKHFMNEVEILTRLRHKYLVILYGCTSSRSHELLLVYEYVANGTVASHLSGERSQGGPLPWHIRMSIAIQTASALTFLHASDIIHRDVKTNNILLDEDFGVKVADFGISRLFPNDVTHVSTAPQGTPGYVDPEYYQCYQLTEKSDVYSFGVVLVELISSKPAVDLSRDKHEINLANFAVNRIQRHALDELIDSALVSELNPETRRMMTSVAELAFRCLQLEKEMRPTMEEILVELNAIASRGNMTSGDKLTLVYDDKGNVLHPSPEKDAYNAFPGFCDAEMGKLQQQQHFAFR